MKRLAVHHAIDFQQKIPSIGFGAMGVSEFYGTTNLNESREAIAAALASGINHFDTADGYAYGDNETFLGNALSLSDNTKRKALIIASKAGILRDRHNAAVRGINIRPDYLRQQLYRSLANLKTDYLDIFYIHRLPPHATEHELLVLADFLLQIKAEGVVRSVGLSEPRLSQLRLIHSHCPVSFVQSEYSLLERGPEKNGILHFCQSHDIRFVAYSPLCRGLLTDTFNPAGLQAEDFRKTLPRFNGENLVYNLGIVENVKRLAVAKSTTVSALALAWLMAQGVIVIPGMRKPDRIHDAVSALNVTLTEDELRTTEHIVAPDSVRGSRYSQAAMDSYGFE